MCNAAVAVLPFRAAPVIASGPPRLAPFLLVSFGQSEEIIYCLKLADLGKRLSPFLPPFLFNSLVLLYCVSLARIQLLNAVQPGIKRKARKEANKRSDKQKKDPRACREKAERRKHNMTVVRAVCNL